MRGPREDFLTIRDYLWRWDTDWFWCSRPFGVQNPVVRALWPRRYRRSDVYRQLVAFDRRYGLSDTLTARRQLPPREAVIQDVEIPVGRGAEFLRFFAADVGMSPVWLCPLRLRSETAWPLYPLEPGELYVNVGFWGTVPLPPGRGDGYHNRLIEDEVAALGGHKSLYSTSFYTEEQFWASYNGPAYDALKRGLRPRRKAGRPVREVRARAVGEGKAEMALADVFERVAGPDAPVEFKAYDGSSAGPPGAPVRITVRSPVAVAYLAQAPGALGLARAYVTGHLDVDGDMYTALARMMQAQQVDISAGRAAAAAARTRRAEAAAAPHPAAPAGGPGQPALAERQAALQAARRRGHLAPLRRVQPVLRVGARAVDGLHLRLLPAARRRRWRRRSRTSTTWWPASWACGPGCGCSTSAAAGAAWCGTRPGSTACRRSA